MRRRAALATIGAALSGLAGCATETGSPTPAALDFSLPAFESGRVPPRFTCDAAEPVSPPVAIERVPEPTESLAFAVEFPNDVGSVLAHWSIWDIPPDTREIPRGVPPTKTVPSLGGAKQGRNEIGRVGYLPLCPPPGDPREFWFTLYALREPLDLPGGASKDDFDEALESAQLAGRLLTATYERGE
ncbi:YbhB/YbcL family Raf kinase inhibitor-like protein [Natronomonas sp. EA1]|uniref:YbhB/YbcL family Raf kinase inhibitor-like protein n=1 Tax=Natronomonas sp. EA1 TaxID=3421655 RepID=UPI003EC1209C